MRSVFSPNYPVERPSTFRNTGHHKLLFPHAVFPAPGYTNFMFAHLQDPSVLFHVWFLQRSPLTLLYPAGECQQAVLMLQSFRAFVFSALGLQHPPRVAVSPVAPITIAIVYRRPYTKFVRHKFLSRQVNALVRDVVCRIQGVTRQCASSDCE
jgi:hypothetical protein